MTSDGLHRDSVRENDASRSGGGSKSVFPDRFEKTYQSTWYLRDAFNSRNICCSENLSELACELDGISLDTSYRIDNIEKRG